MDHITLITTMPVSSDLFESYAYGFLIVILHPTLCRKAITLWVYFLMKVRDGEIEIWIVKHTFALLTKSHH